MENMVGIGLMGCLLVVAGTSYQLGKLHRDRAYVRMLHGAFMANMEECRDTVFAADVMLVSILAGVEGQSSATFFRRMRTPAFRDGARIEAREFIHSLEDM